MLRAQFLFIVTVLFLTAWDPTSATETEKLDRARYHFASILRDFTVSRLTTTIRRRNLTDNEIGDLVDSVADRSAACRLDSMRFFGDELFEDLVDSYANGEEGSKPKALIQEAIRENPNLEAVYVEIHQYIEACEKLIGQELGIEF